VVILDRDEMAGGNHTAFVADLSDDLSVRDAVTKAVAHLGGLDVLVNNAGISAQGTIEDNDNDEWLRVFDVDVLGVVRVSRACLPALRESYKASIVNTSSIAAIVGLPERALYTASKRGCLVAHVGNGRRLTARRYTARWLCRPLSVLARGSQ
jgi:2-keto-3-deoxy-L-fuconate dehydrogenase